MSSSPGPGRSGSAVGPAEVLGDIRRAAIVGADALLQHVPDTGDHATGRAVDAFVEQAGDALRALAQAVGETLATAVGGEPGPTGAGSDSGRSDARLHAAEQPPRGWHR